VARLFGFSFPPRSKPSRHAPFGSGRLPTEERRDVRQAYEAAISKHAEASAVLYRRAADGTAATPEDLQTYAEARARLEVARATYYESLWHL
jgi:hypothetical protein